MHACNSARRPAFARLARFARISLLSLLSLLVLAAVTGCGRKGSGKLLEDKREVGAFSKVALSGGAKLVIRVDPAASIAPVRVWVRGDDDVVPAVHTRVRVGTLRIATPDGIRPSLPLEVSATVATLSAVGVSGAAELILTGLRGPRFGLELSGAAKADLRGSVQSLRIEVFGAAQVRSERLIARDVVVEVSGAGDVRVHATASLRATVKGAAKVRYAGRPAEVVREISGAGSIGPL